ncbi:TniB family NTP-binding protein [Lichenibacterium ramalinae]|uniref:TniB family NTP-binding protein n=1 Tax=Lichenibacterium ramalinae TaxID=2316527 RepID=UPI001A92E592|nr:TniB family NTP-binding protein [Lichenibacterium ramalinae]
MLVSDEGAAGSVPFLVMSRSETGWLLADGRKGVRDFGTAEIATADAEGRILHLPLVAGLTTDLMLQMLPDSIREEIGRRLAHVLRVEQLLARGLRLMVACAAEPGGMGTAVADGGGDEHGLDAPKPVPCPSTVRRWHRAWVAADKCPLALAPQIHLRGNRTPRFAQTDDGTPGPRDLIGETLARHHERGRGAPARAYRSYREQCVGLAVTPVSESAFRRAQRAHASTDPVTSTPDGTGTQPPTDSRIAHAEFVRSLEVVRMHDQDRVTPSTPVEERLLVLAGSRGVGVSTLLSAHVRARGPGASTSRGGTLLVEAPAPAYRPGLGAAILKGLGLNPKKTMGVEQEIAAIRTQLRHHDVGLVLVDNGHLLVEGSAEHRRRSSKFVADLIQAVPVRFVLAGRPPLLALRESLGPRGPRVHEIRPYEPDGALRSAEFADMAARMATARGRSWPTPADPTLFDRLCAATGGAYAEVDRYLGLIAGGSVPIVSSLLAEVDLGGLAGPPDLDPFRCEPDRLREVWSIRSADREDLGRGRSRPSRSVVAAGSRPGRGMGSTTCPGQQQERGSS